MRCTRIAGSSAPPTRCSSTGTTSRGVPSAFLMTPFARCAGCLSGPSPDGGGAWGGTRTPPAGGGRRGAPRAPSRRGKKKALILDTGHGILPFITPDDPDAVAAVISDHSSAPVVDGPAVVASRVPPAPLHRRT